MDPTADAIFPKRFMYNIQKKKTYFKRSVRPRNASLDRRNAYRRSSALPSSRWTHSMFSSSKMWLFQVSVFLIDSARVWLLYLLEVFGIL